MQDLKEIIKVKIEEYHKLYNKVRELDNEIRKLTVEDANLYKTDDLIKFLDTITENQCVLKDSLNSFIILKSYKFYETYIYLNGQSLIFSDNGIEYSNHDNTNFDLSENTIEEITKTLLKFENQEFIKKTLKNYKSFCEKINNGEIE